MLAITLYFQRGTETTDDQVLTFGNSAMTILRSAFTRESKFIIVIHLRVSATESVEACAWTVQEK